MRKITVDDLENLAIGSGILGSGGGGDPAYPLLMVKRVMEMYGPVDVVSVEDLKEEDFVVPLSMMGAPLVTSERLPSGRELEGVLQTIETRLGRSPTVLMPAEIGGANAFTPLLIAAKRRIPVLDADMIGRAFPELQMSSCTLQGLDATPAVMADCMGNTVVLETGSAATLERFARAVTVEMGSSCGVGFYFMSGGEAKRGVIRGSVSQAIGIGRLVQRARDENRDPVSPVVKATAGKVLGRGTLVDVDQSVEKGFLRGYVSILCQGEKIELFYQNEFLAVEKEGALLASTPEILVLMEETSGTPLMSEALRYGLQVVIVALPAPEVWKTAEGLALVGPQAFGYGEVAR